MNAKTAAILNRRNSFGEDNYFPMPIIGTTTCSRIAKIVLLALVMSLFTAAVTTRFPLTAPNAATRANKALASFSASTHHSAPFPLSYPLSKPRRVGPLFLSSSHSSSSNSAPTTVKTSNPNHDNPANISSNTNNDNRIQQQQKQAALSVETYTDYWDNLLLEEHRLALNEWRDRRSKCSLQTLENRGLAISRAFALPDSEVLGEKTVRIHDGSGGKHNNNNNNNNGMLDDGIVGEDRDDRDSRGKNKSNGRGRGCFRRPWNELFSKGDILEMTATSPGGFDSMNGRGSSQAFHRECLIMDVGDTWMLVGVGKTWPLGVWDARKGLRGSSNGMRSRSGADPSYGYPVRLDKTPNGAALIPLRAQRSALQTVREQHQQKQHGRPMMIATWLTKTTKDHCKGYYQLRNKKQWAANSPQHFRKMIANKNGDTKNDSEEAEQPLGTYLREAIERVTKQRSSSKTKNWSATANESQREAVVRALSRRVSSIQGPPGTGKTRVAALLIATALEMAQNASDSAVAIENTDECAADPPHPFRILAVAHSNGAADVLTEALLELGVPAVRAGRPAAISASVRHRSAVALAEKIPQVVRLRKELLTATGNSRDINSRSNIEWELQQCIEDAQDALLDSAPVIVTSCVGAHQLSVRHDKLREGENQRRKQQQRQKQNPQDPGITNGVKDNDVRFPLVVLDEAAQCTEPALMCALVAARAEQLVMVGDTKQLPPTVASSSKELRESLGTSPMDRLEKSGLVEQTILRIQYRMVQALLDHPSKYFYNGLVKSAVESSAEKKMIMPDQDPISEAFVPVEEDPTTLVAPLPTGFAWPNPSSPLAFVNIGRGEAEVLHDSSLGLAGRSNPTEAKLVAQIVADILEEGQLKSSQICVLTPYSKQVSVIRSTLEKESLIRRFRKNDIVKSKKDNVSRGVSNAPLTSISDTSIVRSINDVRVGTVDSFQGQETEVVIFSAVRSNTFSELGFLRDPRRLCVALTRARKGLIILGDSTVLKSCRHWRSLIKSCQDRSCFINEDHISLQPPSNRIPRDDDADNSERHETREESTSIGKRILGDSGIENHTKMAEREKLALLNPDEEFLGLFSTPSINSTRSSNSNK